MENEKEPLNEEYMKLKNSKLKQQILPGWRPQIKLSTTIIIFLAFGGVFILLGILLIIIENQIEEISYRYDQICEENRKSNQNKNNSCNIEIKIKNKMKKKIMIYYEIHGFYQNHRRYIKSKSDDQLKGKAFSTQEMRNRHDCDPAITNKDMGKTKSFTNKNLKDDELAVPCGLMAKSYFNDTFTNWTINGENLYVDEENIAWEADKRIKYKNLDGDKKDTQWIDMTNEHFVVWMRPAGLPNFRKLWGKIENRDLNANSIINLVIEDNFDVSSFKGKKYLVLSTVNALGGKNLFIGISYIIIGGIISIFGLVLIIGYNISRKNK